MAAVARRIGRAPDVMTSAAAGPEPFLMPGASDMESRYCGTWRAPELLGLARPSRQWSTSKTRKEETVAKTWWLVLMVTGTESDGVVGMRAPGQPRRQETKQASKRKEEEAEEEEEEEEEEEDPAQKRRKCSRGPRWGTGTEASAPRHCPLACGVDLALVREARHCLVPGVQTAQTPTPTSRYTACTLR